MLAKPEYSSPQDEVCCWPGAMAELLLAGAPRSAERKEGRCVGDPARENPCWVTSVGDPALGNKGVLGASGLYLNQLRGFCFVVPCQSSK